MHASMQHCIVGFEASGFEWLTSMIMYVLFVYLFVGDSLFQNLFILISAILNFGSQARK
jgi:hypothetical protein